MGMDLKFCIKVRKWKRKDINIKAQKDSRNCQNLRLS